MPVNDAVAEYTCAIAAMPCEIVLPAGRASVPNRIKNTINHRKPGAARLKVASDVGYKIKTIILIW